MPGEPATAAGSAEAVDWPALNGLAVYWRAVTMAALQEGDSAERSHQNGIASATELGRPDIFRSRLSGDTRSAGPGIGAGVVLSGMSDNVA